MKFGKLLAIALVAMGMTACSDNSDGPDTPLSAKEQSLQGAVQDYVTYTVLPTYKAMADAAVELNSLCAAMQEKHAEGTLTEADIMAAGDACILKHAGQVEMQSARKRRVFLMMLNSTITNSMVGR